MHPDRDRISVFVDGPGFVQLVIWDSLGNKHCARSREPLADTDYDTPLWFEFEIGIGDQFGFMAIQIEFKYRADIRIQDFPLELSHEYIIGSDWYTEAWSWFSANELMVYSRPLAFDEKIKLRKYAIERRLMISAGPADKWVVFKGHKFLYTKGHPAARKAGGESL